MNLTDENAFGLFLDLFDIEQQEYGSEPEEFAAHFTRFRDLVLTEAAGNPLGEGTRIMALGHAVYFEVGDGDHTVDPITWLRSVCTPLVRDGFELAALVTYGGRWIDGSAPVPSIEELTGGYRLANVTLPSEPLQRALYGAAFCHGTDGEDGWGTGLFVDTEAVDALGKQLKNAPTPLSAGGATFFRLSLPRP
jgi:hypothetical protein